VPPLRHVAEGQLNGGAQPSHTGADYEKIRIHPLQAMIAGGHKSAGMVTAMGPEGMHRKFEAAFNAGDVAALVALYESNAVLVAVPGHLARGKDAIRAAYQQILAIRPTMRLETTAAFQTADGLALTHGKWRLTGKGPDGQPFQRSGVSAEVLRQQADGSWLYILDNPNVEQPGRAR
jgi:uncharacterized protein (TIGR02246 family)